MRADLQFVAEILAQVVEGKNTESRLKNGAALRQQVLATLSKGETSDHYRAKWLSECIDKVIDLGRAMCREFDEQHTEDMASAADLFDIFRAAAAAVQAQGAPPKSDT